MIRKSVIRRRVAVLWLLILALIANAPLNGVLAQKRQRTKAKLSGAYSPQQQQSRGLDQSLVKPLQWRSIGPYRGGRVTAVAGVASQPSVYYFGATGGGLWKTTDSGVNWEPVSDAFFKTGSVGAIGVCDADPNVLYVGMGESPVRGNVSHGDGVYKSLDAGKTWKRVGLEDTRQIARVRVHPRNPDLVYVAALGHIWAPNEQRGVFRSKDGGKNWERILYRGDKAGAIDLILDPTNPNTLYAGFWEVNRKPYTFESGGAGSGLFKSTDGGDTWTEMTRNTGLPQGLIGKVAITISPVNPERLWAIVEAENGGVFRSDNGGKTWTKTNEERKLRQRAWYYTHIYADPQNADSVYVLNTGFYKSNDAGKTFNPISVPHGDNHDLWIAPNDAARMIEANDGGANVSQNAGKTWTEQDQPTAQFYRVALDGDFPYHVYGAQQDNSTVRIASRTTEAGIDRTDWYDVGGGESGWIAPYPKDSEIVFAGSYGGLITRYDHHTGQLRSVTPWPDNPMGHGAIDLKYRFQWNFPILFSPHDAETLYAAANVLFKSTNQGQSWEVISPDLTRNDKSKQQPAGGAITKDNTSIEYYDTIFTVMESPVQKGTIWAGSDDGLVHVTRDGGRNWENITPKGIPDFIQINSLDASPFDAGTAYVAATMYKWDDYRPYLYKTTDYGKTWRKIANGIPDGAFTRVIREDPNRRGLLYAGTETGIYVSYDDGDNWQSLQLNLPVVPITDLIVHKGERDLIAATQGRAFWILDDLAVLHQMPNATAANNRGEAFLFKPEDTYRLPGGGGSDLPATATLGKNPPNGAVVYYNLKNKPAGQVTLEFLDSSGKSIKKFTSAAPETKLPVRGDAQPQPTPGGTAQSPSNASAPPQATTTNTSQAQEAVPGAGAPPQTPPEQPQAPSGEEVQAAGESRASRVTADAGLNRFVWDMRYADASRFPNLIMWAGDVRGPRVAPGAYQVRLTVNGKALTESFEIKKDPRLAVSPEEFAKQLDLLLKIRDKLTETHDAITQIRDVRKQTDDLTKRIKDQPNSRAILDAAKSLNAKLTVIEEQLYQTKNQSSQDPLNFPIRLNNRLAALAEVVSSADAAPTAQSYAVYEEVTGAINAQLQSFAQIMRTDVDAFNQLVRAQNTPAVIVRPPSKP
ncbi:MAG: glycosyl hydrolase [Pyrinomonadaceae bacterium]